MFPFLDTFVTDLVTRVNMGLVYIIVERVHPGSVIKKKGQEDSQEVFPISFDYAPTIVRLCFFYFANAFFTHLVMVRVIVFFFCAPNYG